MKWEYKRVWVNLATANRNSPEETFNELGSEGWELVSIDDRDECEVWGHFKRPMPEATDDRDIANKLDR